ncbi:AbrB/MazE/SpoVT family DNA-binding domain-containing protein [Bdellovibrionota bacterium FG-2]
MKLKIVQIGNSRGIRLPKPLLEQAGIDQEVEIQVEGNTLVLRPIHTHIRRGWEKAFQTMAEKGDDSILDNTDALATKWESTEWEWK